MELKRIIARDSRSANEKAIQMYGPDVLIISSQRVDQQTELIVAVDVEPVSLEALDAAEREQASETLPVMSAAENDSKTMADGSNQFMSFSQVFHGTQAPNKKPEIQGTLSGASPDVFKPAAQALQDGAALTFGSAAALPREALTATHVSEGVKQSHHEMQRSHEIVELLRQEMAALRQEFALSRRMMSWQDGLTLAPEIQRLTTAMMEVGMPAGLRTLLTDSIQHLETQEQAWPVLEQLLIDALARSEQVCPVSGVHALCGPSGAGKTSMVARLAYAAAQVHGVDQQAMISFSDQRPGAWAQMQLLAAQAGVACFRATDPAMLKTLLDDLAGKTIWIDTCGTDFLAQAELLKHLDWTVLLHAVLPADATVTSVQKILQNSAITWNSLMLTKIDEAAFPWPLIKGLSDYALPVSCMVGSNRVALAPVAFDARTLVQLAFEPLHNASSLASPGVSPTSAWAMPVAAAEASTSQSAQKVVHG